MQSFDLLDDGWDVFKKHHCLVDSHVEHIVDRLTFVAYLQGLAVVALALTFLANHGHIREEVHLDKFHASALTGFATTALHIERETSGFVIADLGLGQLSEELADVVKHLGVGGWVGAWRAPNGGLVNFNDLVNQFNAFNAGIG